MVPSLVPQLDDGLGNELALESVDHLALPMARKSGVASDKESGGVWALELVLVLDLELAFWLGMEPEDL